MQIITNHCIIRNQQILLNGNVIFEGADADFDVFSKAAYRHFGILYPKFFKMDNLCKLAFLAAEVLIAENEELKELDPFDIGVILANASASEDTDLKYHESSKLAPSPALFVYTLPNIAIGEICIRHGFKGENTFFILEKYEPTVLINYINSLLENNTGKAIVAGWVELNKGDYEAFLYIVRRAENGVEHHSANIQQLYA